VSGWSGGVDAEAVTGGGAERAPVSGGAVLWLEAEAREVVAVRHRSGEGEFDQLRGAFFKRGAGGEATEGGLVGVGRRGRRVEVEREGRG
jgi:hypothetical protein